MFRTTILRPGVLASGLLLCVGHPANAATPNLVARVDAAGGLIGGSEVTGVVKLGLGMYEVTFGQAVNGCAFLATTVNLYAQALKAYTAGGHLSVNGVYVETKNGSGNLTDAPFELVVNCGLNGMKYAVVDYNGDLARSTAGTALSVVGTGQYNLKFSSTIKNCAYVATVADPGNALVRDRPGVYTGSGPSANTVYIETKDPNGGLTNGVPFHLGVFCNNTRSRYAVVQDSGIIKRGSSLTSAFRNSTGNYTVVTTATVDPNCAAVATRGSVGNAVPFTPATVEVVPGPASNTRDFQVRELSRFGGSLLNEAFHAALVCR